MANQSLTGVSPAKGTQKYFADAYCSPAQRAIEEESWGDAGRYAQALASWRPNGTFQPAMDLYMGTDSAGLLWEVLEGMVSELDLERISSSPSRSNAGFSSEHHWCLERT